MKPFSRFACSVVISLVLLTGSATAGVTTPMPAAPPPPDPQRIQLADGQKVKPMRPGAALRLIDIIQIALPALRFSISY